jgi:hypothetical protein
MSDSSNWVRPWPFIEYAQKICTEYSTIASFASSGPVGWPQKIYHFTKKYGLLGCGSCFHPRTGWNVAYFHARAVAGWSIWCLPKETTEGFI